MNGNQARNIRKELERLLEIAHKLGFVESALVGFLEQLARTPGLIHLRQYEAMIREDEHVRTSIRFERIITELELTYIALANVAVIARTIDLAVSLRDKYDLLLGALQGTSENLEETFADALNVAGPRHRRILDELRPDIEERIECTKQIVAILSKPNLSAQSKKDQLQPYVDRIEAVAPRHGQILADLGAKRQEQNRGGGRRPKGASRPLRWLAKRYDELDNDPSVFSHDDKVECIQRELRRHESEKLYEDLTKDDRKEIMFHLTKAGAKKYLQNLASKHRRGLL